MTDKEPVRSDGEIDRTQRVLLECLADENSPVHAAIRDLIVSTMKRAEVSPDAETLQNILELIDKRIVHKIRPDAFRNPASAHNARL